MGVVEQREPTFEEEDKVDALKAMEEDLPWTPAFALQDSCLQSAYPYTIRFTLTHGESIREVDCLRPWRTHTWMCFDEELEDAADECEKKNRI